MPQIQKTIHEFIDDRELPMVGPDDHVAAAVEVMRARKSDCVVVVDDGVLVGIFTERDFLTRVSAEQLSPGETPMREVMTANPDTLHPTDCISYAINRMAVGGFRNVPIVDVNGKVHAVLNARDVVGHLNELFGELEEGGTDSDWREWEDIGGG